MRPFSGEAVPGALLSEEFGERSLTPLGGGLIAAPNTLNGFGAVARLPFQGKGDHIIGDGVHVTPFLLGFLPQAGFRLG